GSGTADFAVDPSNTTCTNGLVLLPGVSCNYSVNFTPLAGSALDGLSETITFSWTGQLTGQKAVTAMGTGETGVTLYQNTLNVPQVYVGAKESQSNIDQIFNGTSSTVTINSIVLSGANPQDFVAQLDTSCSTNTVIPANSVCYLDGSFAPLAVGTRTTTVTINYTINSAVPTNGALTLNVTGTGAAGPVIFPASFGFGSQIVSLLAPTQRVLFENVGKVPVTISSVSGMSGANASDFQIAGTSTCASNLTVPNGGKCYFDLTFTPGGTLSRTASFTVTDNGPGSPRTLTLTGTGVPQASSVSVSQNALDFGGKVLLATGTQPTATATFYLINAGAAPATITLAPALTTASTVFAVSTAANVTTCVLNQTILPQGGTCAVGVTFKPADTNPASDSVMLTYKVGATST
ncbi:MAG: choice-of-anchor D domain-containing protein, partial [Candidatus Acidiferrales bacterium]